MVAYSQDLRERVLRACERGDSPSQIARRFLDSERWSVCVTQAGPSI